MRFARAACAVTCGLALALAPKPALAGDPAAAREQLKLGYTLAQDGKCVEAIPHLAESLRLDPKAITLINLANCEEREGRLVDALAHWIDARARAQSESNAGIEAEAEKRAKALEPRLPKLTIALQAGAPTGTEVIRDGVALGSISVGMPLPVNPGAHTIVVRAPEHEDTTTTISLAESENKHLDVAVGAQSQAVSTPTDPTGPTGERHASPLVFAGFGVATVGVAVGAVTGLLALGKASSARTACPNLECQDQGALDAVSSGRTLGTISTIGFAAGGVGAIIGIYGLVQGGGRKEPTVSLVVGPGSGGLRGSF